MVALARAAAASTRALKSVNSLLIATIGEPELKKISVLRRPGTSMNDVAAVSSVRSVRRARSRASSATSSLSSTLPSSMSVVDVRRTFIGSALRFAFAAIARCAEAMVVTSPPCPANRSIARSTSARSSVGSCRVSPRPVVVTTDTRSPGWT